MQPNNSDHIEYSHSGMIFKIRSKATRGDQYEMNSSMAESSEISDGRIIKTNSTKLFPWLIRKFVISCDKIQGNGDAILKGLLDQPATPGEDLILVLGSYILNHVGLLPDTEEKKKV